MDGKRFDRKPGESKRWKPAINEVVEPFSVVEWSGSLLTHVGLLLGQFFSLQDPAIKLKAKVDDWMWESFVYPDSVIGR